MIFFLKKPILVLIILSTYNTFLVQFNLFLSRQNLVTNGASNTITRDYYLLLTNKTV